MEAPYVSVAGLPLPPSGFQRALIMATRGLPAISLGYNAYVAKEDPEEWEPPEEWYPPVDIALFTPSGELDSAIDELTREIVVSSGVDTGIIESVSDTEFGNGTNLAWVEADGVQEFIAFRDVVQDGDAITLQIVARGCLDTAPTAFPAGARVWFLSQASEVVEIRAPIPPATEVVNAITFQPYNNWGEYPFNMLDFVELPVGVLARRDKVYCPTDVRFNDESYPASITGELTVSWSHRNRLGTWSYADSGKTTTTEPATEYDVLVYGELGTLVHTETGLTGTSWTYLEADEIAESGLGRLNTHLRVVIQTLGSSRSHEAIRQIEWEFDRI